MRILRCCSCFWKLVLHFPSSQKKLVWIQHIKIHVKEHQKLFILKKLVVCAAEGELMLVKLSSLL